MFVYDFSFRSLTAAQDGRSVLQNAGVFSQLARAPKQIAEQGCGYVLEVDGPSMSGSPRSRMMRSGQCEAISVLAIV